MSTYTQFFGGGITAVETFIGDGIEDTFVLSAATSSTNRVAVSVNGLLQEPIEHYSIIDGELSFTEVPNSGDQVLVYVFGTSRVV